VKTNEALPEKASALLVIGCSAGGVDALSRILPAIPRNAPFATAVVIHLPSEGDSMLPRIFSEKLALTVKEAEDKEELRSSAVYFAPSNYHLLVEAEGSFSFSVDEPVNFSRPSIDVLFESAALAFGPRVVGILLTGANADGSEGLRKIVRHGGRAIIQDPETAESFAMPEAGVRALAEAPKVAKAVLALDGIANVLRDPTSAIMENLWKR
jgi:two-component system chemotaxis response regulator CheB